MGGRLSYILSIDPGLNTGAALGYFDATTPYRLIERFQIHGGASGFTEWWRTTSHHSMADLLVVESFNLREENNFAADLTPKEVEGAIIALLTFESEWHARPIFQPPSDKGRLIGYSDKAKNGTKAMRQRERFNFLDRFGLFRKGTENDDSNDAITHALVYLKRAGHHPTQATYWPPRQQPTFLLYNSDISPDLREAPGF